MYQDTMVYCKDEMVKTNRLVMGLIFPQLGSWEGFSQATPVEVILSDWERKEVEEMIEKLLGGKEGVEEYETANYSNATNSDAPDDEKFEIKTEGEAEIITISPNVMDEEDKDSTSYDDDATELRVSLRQTGLRQGWTVACGCGCMLHCFPTLGSWLCQNNLQEVQL